MSRCSAHPKSRNGTIALITIFLFANCGGKAFDDPGGDGGRDVASGGERGTGGSPPLMSAGGGITPSGGGMIGVGEPAGGAAGTGGDVLGGAAGALGNTGGISGSLDAPWEQLYGNYDLLVVPAGPECERLSGHVNLSLREGVDGPEARIFRNFEWNGWPDVVVEDANASGVWIQPGESESLHELVNSQGFFLPYNESGFVMDTPQAGQVIVNSDCGSGPTGQPALVYLYPDTTPPRVREELTTRFNFYPFTWTFFRFSEPLGFTGDTYPYLGFTEKEQGEALLALRDFNGVVSQAGELQAWPWGPTWGFAFTAPEFSRGGSVYFDLIGDESDAAGNTLYIDNSTYDVVDIGPLEARHDFDEAPPLFGFTQAEYIAPAANNLCESDGGCVLVRQSPGNCDLDGNLVGSPPQQFAFRVGGPDVSGGLTSGVRIHYRQVAMADYGHTSNFIFGQSGVADFTPELADVSGAASGSDSWTFTSEWTDMVLQTLLAPADEFAVVLSWECFPGVQPDRALVIEWVEATVP